MCAHYHSQGTYVSIHDSIAIVLIKVFTVCTRLDRNTQLLHVCHLITQQKITDANFA